MKTQNKIKLIKVVYIIVLVSAFIGAMYNGGLQGFKDGWNDESGPASVSVEFLSFFRGLLIIAIVFLSLSVFVYLYRFIDSVEKEEVFSDKNIQRLDLVGWYCVAHSFSIFLFNCLALANLNLSTVMGVAFEFWLLMLGVTLLTISFVFRKGVEIKQENDLTI